MKFAISHLIDDASYGGVNHMLKHMTDCGALAQASQHRIVRVKRGQLSPPRLQADVIVSHMVVNWANLPLLTALRAAYPNTPLIHVEHSYSERFTALNVPARERFDSLLRAAYALFDKVVAVSAEQAGWMLRRRFCLPQNLAMVEPCVTLAPFRAARGSKLEGPIIVGAIGRFDIQKGFDILIEAFRQMPEAYMHLHLYGDGAEEPLLRRLAGGKANIVFKGYAAAPAEAMAACDLIAMPSRWEPYGLVALETASAGLPLICARVDGLASHIRRGAIEIGENSPQGWTAVLRQMNHRGALAAMPKTGVEHADGAEARFASEWLALIETVMQANCDQAAAA